MFKVFIFTLFLLSSCSTPYLVKYSIAGGATEAKITYLNNGVSVTENITLPYSKETFTQDIGIHIYNIIGGVVDCRVLFIHNSGWQMYKRVESDYEIIIKGRLNSVL